jgi:hypothetical protein
MNDLKDDSNKQMNEVNKSIQDLDEKFSKEIQILKKMSILEMKSSINQI